MRAKLRAQPAAIRPRQRRVQQREQGVERLLFQRGKSHRQLGFGEAHRIFLQAQRKPLLRFGRQTARRRFCISDSTGFCGELLIKLK